MLARCLSASLQGLEARPVTVEVDLAPGLPGVQLVGLPDKVVVLVQQDKVATLVAKLVLVAMLAVKRVLVETLAVKRVLVVKLVVDLAR